MHNTSSSILYPNPFNAEATLMIQDVSLNNASLKVFNASGTLVESINNISENQIRITRKELVNGIYFYQLFQDGKQIVSGKFMLN